MSAEQDLAGRKAELLRVIESSLGKVAERPGCVLMTGWNTVAPGPIYIKGLNPGDDKKCGKSTVLEYTRNWADDRNSYCKDEWSFGKVDLPGGKHPHQRRVRKVIEWLRLDEQTCFGTNAIFIQTKDAASLKDANKLWDKCWPVHQYLLSIVKPKVILCLGNGQDTSPFAYMVKEYTAKVEYVSASAGSRNRFRYGKWFWDVERNLFVIGIPHPGRFDVKADAFKTFLAEKILPVF